MKGLFCLFIGFLTGSPTLHLDGEESPIEESNLTKSESVQNNDSQNKDAISKTESKDINTSPDNGSSSSEAPVEKSLSLSERFERMYLKMYEHEHKLLDNEKKIYDETGIIDEDNYSNNMADIRKNDHVNLANHIKSSTTDSEEFSGLPENKRDNDFDNENSKNKVQKK